jgi:hypothetical protein
MTLTRHIASRDRPDADAARGGRPSHAHAHDGAPMTSFQPVLTIRAHVEARDIPSFIFEGLEEIRSYVAEHHLRVEGAPFSTSHPAPDHRFDVEVGWPVAHAEGAGRIHGGTLPPQTERRLG